MKFPIILNNKYYVTDDSIQWILMVREGSRKDPTSQTGLRVTKWHHIRWFRTKTALKRDIKELCGKVDPYALELINSFPEIHK